MWRKPKSLSFLNSMADKKFRVVIVGGGSSHTPGIIQSLIENLERFPLKKLVL